MELLIKSAKAGKSINLDEIPPPVKVTISSVQRESQNTSSEVTKPNADVPNDKIQLLTVRCTQYKKAALAAKRDDNIEVAKQFLLISKVYAYEHLSFCNQHLKTMALK